MMVAQLNLLDSLAFGSEENEAEKEKKSAFDEASQGWTPLPKPEEI
jgi:hypothetical protein